MIINYHRPENLNEALDLISIKTPVHVPLGGGTYLSHGYKNDCEVVDLQKLKLGNITSKDNFLNIGATVSLTMLQDNGLTPDFMIDALQREKNRNIRNRSTVAGTIRTCSGRSIFAGLLLALEAEVMVEPGSRKILFEDFLSSRANFSGLITSIRIPLNNSAVFEAVSRTPADFPVIYLVVGTAGDGRKRVVIGGSFEKPVLVVDSKPEKIVQDDLEKSINHACSLLDNKWASFEYYKNISSTLLERINK